MITIRRANERGHAEHGWLNTYHTFSFNTYYDENHMGFRALRVLNDDRVQPGRGFGSHPHQDMEIITYVLEGALEHKDSMGHGSVIHSGDVQIMSAGKGVVHSEKNASPREAVHFLQIWIVPDEKGAEPSYAQIRFSRADKLGKLCPIASKNGLDGSASIRQDVNVYATILEQNISLTVPVISGRHLWIHVAQGEAQFGNSILLAGDGLAVSGETEVQLTGIDDAEILVFDLA